MQAQLDHLSPTILKLRSSRCGKLWLTWYPFWIRYGTRAVLNKNIRRGANMQEVDVLEAAFQMLDQFRGNAELRAGEEMDRAVERGDDASFDRWRLIAQTIVAHRGRQYPLVQVEEDRPAEPVRLVRAGAGLVPA